MHGCAFLVLCSSIQLIAVQAKTYNQQRPFGNSNIPSVLRAEFFSGKGTANIQVFRSMLETKRVNDITISLICTVVIITLPCLPTISSDYGP